MGVVHLARGPAGPAVALKVLRPQVVGDDEGRARLAREVTSLRRVRSPRVAEIYDADPWGELPFVIMRYVSGPSLHEVVDRRGPLSGEALWHLALGLAEALVAVHEAGVLHRDIKPSNVLLENGQPVLIDFGLAKLAEDSKLTATGWLLGTPGYLAPEVLYGDSASPAADVHAWAATVTYAATGRSPYGGGPGIAILDRARRGEHDLAGLPYDLVPLLRQCLAPDPRQRPDASHVVAQLQPSRRLPPGPPPVTPPTRVMTAPAPRPWSLPNRQRPPTDPPPREPVSTAPSRTVQSAAVLALLAAVAAGVSLAPYITVVLAFLLAWVLRTASWGVDARLEWHARRGPRRGDHLLTTVAAPWYAVVALPGSVGLIVVATLAGATIAAFVWLFGLTGWHALLPGGVCFATVLWWGPGGRRLRRSTRRTARRLAASPGAGPASVFALVLASVLLLLAHANIEVIWWPQSGPPVDVSMWPPWLQP